MRTRNITVSDDYVPTINLGRQGENAVSQVIFDVSSLITDYGAGTGTVVVQRPGESTTYQHDDTVQSGDTVTWTVSSADTELAGTGMVQLFWIVDNAIAKTITYQSYTEPALMNPTDAPVSPTGWISEEIGNLDDLNTTDKSSLVGAINEIAGGSASGVTDELRQALLQIASKVAYIDEHGQDYYDDLYDALYAVTAIRINARSISLITIGGTSQLTATTVPEGANVTWSSSNESVATVDGTGLVTSTGYGSATITATAGSKSATCSVVVAQATLVNISAVYTPSGTVYDSDSLDSLKDDLVVTALWDNGTTSEIPGSDYTLSGTLETGTSTITVSYGGKETTFAVTVVGLVSISAVYTQSGTVYDTDSLDDLKADLVVTANYSDSSTQTITDYTLSGTLAEGTSTITVSYGGKTTTFNVTVSERQYEYITNGLIARYDGINNTGSGHDSSATTWKDLVGDIDFTTLTDLTWDDDGLVFSGTNTTFAKTDSIWAGNPLSDETIEIVLAPSLATSNNNQIIGSFDLASPKRRFELLSNGDVTFIAGNSNNWINPTGDFTEIKTISCVWASNLIAKTFINNIQLSQSSNRDYNSRNNNAYVSLGGSDRDTYNKYPYTGKIMAIRVYGRALTNEELTNNFLADKQRFNLGV